jgi:hypothetical protein
LSPLREHLLPSMVVEASGMSDVSIKSALPRKSAFSCEACRKRKVGSYSGKFRDR